MSSRTHEPDVFRDEVVDRWGQEAYDSSDRWWRGLGPAGRQDFLRRSQDIAAEWAELASSQSPGAAAAQRMARLHISWVADAWGGVEPSADAIAGLADLYVDDARFAEFYGGQETARFIRAALRLAVGHDVE